MDLVKGPLSAGRRLSRFSFPLVARSSRLRRNERLIGL
jgi:hypothetical protein